MSRHPATQNLLRWFQFDHLPLGPIRDASTRFYFLAIALADELGDGPEVSAGLRKLLEAKDCFVRAAVAKTVDE